MHHHQPKITEDQVKDILVHYLNKKRLFGKLSLDHIKIESLKSLDEIIVSCMHEFICTLNKLFCFSMFYRVVE